MSQTHHWAVNQTSHGGYWHFGLLFAGVFDEPARRFVARVSPQNFRCEAVQSYSGQHASGTEQGLVVIDASLVCPRLAEASTNHNGLTAKRCETYVQRFVADVTDEFVMAEPTGAVLARKQWPGGSTTSHWIVHSAGVSIAAT
ncbi:hypothetical protein [uncultured Mycobacterium sp.]|uniref:hypothetical protein n=1 Tax=uncultured Mycobacterium sp. TaxID=171292 RepID=UPI0035CCA21B